MPDTIPKRPQADCSGKPSNETFIRALGIEVFVSGTFGAHLL